MDRPVVRAGFHRDRGADDRRSHAAPGWPLPAAVDDRMGAVDRAGVRQHGDARPPHRHLQHPADPPVRLVARRSARGVLPDLAAGGAGRAVLPQRAGVAPRARDPLPARRRHPAGQRGRRRVPGAAVAVRAGRAAGRGRRLALCTRQPVRQPVAVRRARQHRVPVDGGGRRFRASGRRAGRRGRRAGDEERRSGHAAARHRARRPVRSGGVRAAVHRVAAPRARRRDGIGDALDAHAFPTARGRAAARAGRGPAAAPAGAARPAVAGGARCGQTFRRPGGGERGELRGAQPARSSA